MSAINFSKLPMTKKDFVLHFTAKIENNKWLGHLFEYSQSGQNEREDRPETLEEVQPIIEPFASFPYEWDVKKSKVQIDNFNPIVESHTEFDGAKPNYFISIPFHNASVEAVKAIVRSIEDESFGQTPQASHALVSKRVAIVIGLNNCRSCNPYRNDTFRIQVARIRATTVTSCVSLTILPFFWGYPWVSKSKKELGQTLIFRRIYTVTQCYRIANSYHRYFRGSAEHLWISDRFNQKGNPSEKTIPYQMIRNQILHSVSLRGYFTSTKSPLKYVVSLDGDFSSLKAVGSKTGLLSHYNMLIYLHHKQTKAYPDVVSTGYQPPASEKNGLIKAGVVLDRSIRAVIPGKFVYMPEPNFAFLITNVGDLGRLSWMGGATMDTESRRLIANGLALGIFDSDHFVFSNRGGIQTAIDAAWRTKSVNKFAALKPAQLKQKGVQKALRGIHQSYADPQIWATNVYAGLQISVSAYMKECITPMKGIRELFDPITLRNDRYGADRTHASDFASLFRIYPIYLKYMEDAITSIDDSSTLAAEFVEEAQIVGKTLREGWENFMENQHEKFHGFRELLDKNYTEEQIDEVVQAALATGKAIKDFYAKGLAASKA